MADDDNKDSYARPSGVLENKFGLDNEDRLLEVETANAHSRISELRERDPIEGNFDREHLKKVHAYIFQDTYPWAGRMRDEKFSLDGKDYKEQTITKGGTQFLPPSRFDMGFSEAFKPIADRDQLTKGDDQAFANKAGLALSQLNYVHPFREGNGRTQRAFIEQLGRETGHDVNFSVITRARMIEASIAATYDPASPAMPDVIRDATDRGRQQSLTAAADALRDAGADPDEYVIEVSKVGEQYQGSILSHDNRTATIITDGPLITIDTRDMPSLETNKEVTVDVQRDVSTSYGPEREKEIENDRAKQKESANDRDAEAER